MSDSEDSVIYTTLAPTPSCATQQKTKPGVKKTNQTPKDKLHALREWSNFEF